MRDGCIGETRSALAARALSRVACTTEEREALERIADDEARHAQLAFDAVAWIEDTFGDPIRDELGRLAIDSRG